MLTIQEINLRYSKGKLIPKTLNRYIYWEYNQAKIKI